MQEAIYRQPFIDLTPLDQYPKIKDLAFKIFPEEKEGILNNLYVIMCALLANSSIAVSRDHSWYKRHRGPDWYTRSREVHAQDLLVNEGFVRIKRGYPAREGYEKGFSSVLTRTKKLEELLRSVPLQSVRVDFSDFSPITLDRASLERDEIKNLGDGYFLNGVLNIEFLLQAYERMQDLNERYFGPIILNFSSDSGLKTLAESDFDETERPIEEDSKLDVRMATNVFLTRMFTKKGCGRFYQRSQSYQQLPREMRRHLLINGEKTGEADYAGMHINLAYFISGHDNPHPGDSYNAISDALEFPDDNEMREAIKRTVLVAFNTPNRTSCSRAMCRNYFHTYYATLKRHGISVGGVYDAFRSVHPNIRDIFFAEEHKADLLMFHESNVMLRVLQTLGDEGIRGIPLHDSVICEKRNIPRAREIMEKEYATYTGGNGIVVKTRT